MAEFKKSYELEEVKEMVQWMKDHENEFPKTFEPLRGFVITDMHRYVESLSNMMPQCTNPVLAGFFHKAFVTKEKLEEQITK